MQSLREMATEKSNDESVCVCVCRILGIVTSNIERKEGGGVGEKKS